MRTDPHRKSSARCASLALPHEVSPAPGDATAELRNSSLRADFAATAFVQLAVTVASFLVVRLIYRRLTAAGVGEYALVRRALYLLQPITLLGITVAVPKFLPAHRNDAERSQIATVGFTVVMAAAAIVAVAMIAADRLVASALFGDPLARPLVWSFAGLAIAFTFHSYVYGYFRGLLRMRTANMLDLGNSALAPVIAVLVASRWRMPGLIVTLAVIVSIWTIRCGRPLFHEFSQFARGRHSWYLTRLLLRFGAQRVPGDFALAGLLLGAPLLVAHTSSLIEVGQLAVGQNLLVIPATALTALSIVLLPYVSDRLAAGDVSSIQRNCALLFNAAVDLSCLFAALVFVVAEPIMKLWLGDSMGGAALIVRPLMLAVPLHVLYFVFRSVIDASTSRPLTTLNLLAGLVVFIASFFVLRWFGITGALPAAWALTIGFAVVGCMTVWGVGRLHGWAIFADRTALVTSISSVLAGCAVFGLRRALGLGDVASALVCFPVSAAYFLLLLRLRRGWLVSTLDVVMSRFRPQ